MITHFTLQEFFIHRSSSTVLQALSQPSISSNIHACMSLCEDIREHINAPIIINSCYRDKGSNSFTPGASKTSQHLTASAVDIRTSDMNKLYDFFDTLTESLAFGMNIGQVIFYDSFVHVGLSQAFGEPNRPFSIIYDPSYYNN